MPPHVPLEHQVEQAFNRFWGWGYSLTNPQIPDMLPGIPDSLRTAVALRGKKGVTNCTVLGGWVVLAAVPEARAVPGLWLDIQVGRGPDLPWSGIEGLVNGKLGVRDDAFSELGVYVAQTWSNLEDGRVVSRDDKRSAGHLRIVTVVNAGSLQVREASQSKGGVVVSLPDRSKVKWWGHETRAVRLFDR